MKIKWIESGSSWLQQQHNKKYLLLDWLYP
nr:MAG TPA: hypothetical protein [Caudoviricetes sp.]